MAEGVGFEPTELSLNGFQDRRLKPLGHPSGVCVSALYHFTLALSTMRDHWKMKGESAGSRGADKGSTEFLP